MTGILTNVGYKETFILSFSQKSEAFASKNLVFSTIYEVIYVTNLH